MKPTDESGRDWPVTLGLTIAAGLGVLLMRLVPEWPANFVPVGALGLFAGARFRSWRAFVVPLAVMTASDALLWAIRGYPPFNPWVYSSFMVYVLAGRLFVGQSAGAVRIGFVSLAGGMQFFLLTVFGAWLAGSTPERAADVDPALGVAWQTDPALQFPYPSAYSRDVRGLTACYAAAAPFFRTNAPPLGFLGNALAADLLFSAALFGLSALARRSADRPVQEPAAHTEATVS